MIEIIKYPDKRLTTKCEEIKNGESYPRYEMMEYIEKNNGV